MEKINQDKTQKKYFCDLCNNYHSFYEPSPKPSSFLNDNLFTFSILNLFKWIFVPFFKFTKATWFYCKKFFRYIIPVIFIWLLSLFNIKLPNLPFLPFPSQASRQEEKKQEQEDKSQPPEQPTKTITTTNTITQTNIVTQTNYVNQTVYVTNFVVQPIVVTNTVYKDVPLTITNIFIIKNYSNNNGTNKNNLQNGPAYYLSEDLNTLIQNQTQNPVRGQLVN